MLKEDAKRYVLAKWWALPPEERRTENQAAGFAMRMANEVHFRAHAERYQLIMGWLLKHLSRE